MVRQYLSLIPCIFLPFPLLPVFPDSFPVCFSVWVWHSVPAPTASHLLHTCYASTNQDIAFYLPRLFTSFTFKSFSQCGTSATAYSSSYSLSFLHVIAWLTLCLRVFRFNICLSASLCTMAAGSSASTAHSACLDSPWSAILLIHQCFDPDHLLWQIYFLWRPCLSDHPVFYSCFWVQNSLCFGT